MRTALEDLPGGEFPRFGEIGGILEREVGQGRSRKMAADKFLGKKAS